MLKIISKFNSNKLLASFSILISGTILAQVIGILLSPIITRLYTPEQMGIYTIITTAISLFGPIVCLKYDMGIIVSSSEEEEYALIKLSLIISVFSSFIFSIVYVIFCVRSENVLFILFVSISICTLLICYGINNILISFNNKNSQYTLISSVTIIKSWVNNILMLIGGLVKVGILGLVVSQVLGYLSGVKRQSTILLENRKKLKEINFNKIKKVLIKYKKQAIYNTPSAFSTALIYSSINIFINLKYSVEILGLYSLSYRVLGIPFSLISANIARIFFDYASNELKEEGKFDKIFIKVSLIISIIVIPIMLFLALIAPQLFSLVFGEKWYGAGVFVRLLTPMFTIRLIVESLTTSFIISDKQQIELLFYIFLLFGEILIYLLVFICDFNINVLLILISVLYVSVYMAIYIYMLKISRIEYKIS